MTMMVALVIIQIGLSLMFAGAAVANYLVLQSISLKVSELNSNLREWAHSMFAERTQVEKLEKRILELERSGN